MSPFGGYQDPKSGKFVPMSMGMKFSEEDEGTPIKAYRLLINAFKLHRQETCKSSGKPDKSRIDKAVEEFRSFMEKGKQRDFLPSWWKPANDVEQIPTCESISRLTWTSSWKESQQIRRQRSRCLGLASAYTGRASEEQAGFDVGSDAEGSFVLVASNLTNKRVYLIKNGKKSTNRPKMEML